MSQPSTAGSASCSRRRHTPPRPLAASIGPWAPPPVPVSPPGGGCCLNQANGSVFRREPVRCSRATKADHSKLNLARLYRGASNAHSPGSAGAVDWPRIGRTSTARRSPSSALPRSASCCEGSAIPHDVPGQTLILQLSLVASDSSYLWDDCVEVSHVGRLGKRPCLA